MAGLLSYSLTGIYLLFLSLLETLTIYHPSFSSLPPLSLLLFSSLFLLHSLFTFSVSSLPLSSLSLLTSFSLLVPSLSPLSPLLSLSTFLLDFLLFYLKNTATASNLESQYYSLMLVPAILCLSSTTLLLIKPGARPLRLARAISLALHGTWVIQTGFSFFTSAMTHGCFLGWKGREFSVGCRGHEELHRGMAIATLLFNCHLALVLAAVVGVYALLVNKGRREMGYSRLELNKEMERFSLGEDEEGKSGGVALPVLDAKGFDVEQ